MSLDTYFFYTTITFMSKRKILGALGLLLFIIILPAGSWYYLQTGLNYRKAAAKELTPKGTFSIALPEGKGDRKINVICLDEKGDQHLQQMVDQFSDSEYFRLWATTASVTGEAYEKLDESTYAQLINEYPNANYILTDTAYQLRKVYSGVVAEDIQELVPHIALILPRPREKDIKMKENK